MDKTKMLLYFSDVNTDPHTKIAYHIPWYYDKGSIITDGIKWNDEIIDKCIKVPRIMEMIEKGTYYLQFYPVVDNSIARHMYIDPKHAIGKIINIDYKGIDVIPIKDIDYKIKYEDAAFPILIQYNKEAIFLGGMYLRYKYRQKE